MPWKPEDAQSHTHLANTPEKQRRWAAIANAALADCLDKGKSQEECEARAIRIANAAMHHNKDVGFTTVAFKGYDSKERLVWGYANVAVIDRGGDLIEAEAWPSAIADFLTRPLLLFMHQPIKAGEIVELKIDSRGLWVKARVTLPGAWEKVLSGEITGFSIGWLPLPDGSEFKVIGEKTVRVIKKLFLFEISLVDTPMNQESLIEGMEEKMLTQEQIFINRETGEILVSNLSDEQMAEFMKMLDVLLGGQKCLAQECPSPSAIVFKRAHKEPEKSILERIIDIVKSSKEERMSQEVQTILSDYDKRLKAIEDAVAKIPDVVQTAVQGVFSKMQEEQKPHDAEPTQNDNAPKDTKGDVEAALKQAEQRFVEILKTIGLSDDEIAKLLCASPEAPKEEPLARSLKALEEKLENLQAIIEELPVGSVTQRIRTKAPHKTRIDMSALPGANLIPAVRE